MKYYLRENKFNFAKVPPTSGSTHNHIQQAFLLSHIRYNSCFCEIPFSDPLHYGCALINEVLMPDFETEIVPEDFSLPCSCPKCPCRKSKISSGFCKYQRHSICKNPENVSKSK